MIATAAPDQDAIAHFAVRLRYETDPADVAAARAAGADLVLIDVRSQLAWDQGHVPGARHLPLAELEARVGRGSRTVPPNTAPAADVRWSGCS